MKQRSIILSVLMLVALVSLTGASSEKVEKKNTVVQKAFGQWTFAGECMVRSCSETVIEVVFLPIPPFFFPVPITNFWTESAGCDPMPGGEEDDPIPAGGCNNC